MSAVLALQGSVEPHRRHLEALGQRVREVRRREQLEGVTHLILPGGESTTLHLLLTRFGLWEELARRGADGSLAMFGTCAGAILLGRGDAAPPPRLGLIDIGVDRNAYGRQLDSFERPVRLQPAITGLPDTLPGVFIRAPRLRDPGPSVEVLATLDDQPVLVRQGRHLASAFHPELTADLTLHQLFLAA